MRRPRNVASGVPNFARSLPKMTAAIFYAKTKMGWKETVGNEPANKNDKPFLVDDARQRLFDEVDRIRARKEQKDK